MSATLLGTLNMSAVERESLDGIVREHGAMVWKMLRRLGVADADVDDVCQDVFIIVGNKLATFEGRSSLKTWLRGICLKKAAGYRRKRVRGDQVLVKEEVDAPDDRNPERALGSKETLALLDRALDAIDDEKREVFVLFELEGVEMSEIAELAGCPLQTAYSRLYAARAELEKFVRRETQGRRG